MDIKTAIQKTLAHEGGFQANPDDHANWTGGKIGVGELVGTKFGITAVDLPGVSIKDLTEDQAIAYYQEHYVKSGYAQIESQFIGEKLFDLGVLFGVRVATGVLQAVLGITTDGIFGPTTLQSINQSEPASLYKAYVSAMVTHAINVANANPAERQFLAGWIKRINVQ